MFSTLSRQVACICFLFFLVIELRRKACDCKCVDVTYDSVCWLYKILIHARVTMLTAVHYIYIYIYM